MSENQQPPIKRAPDLMEEGAATFRERNAEYGDSYLEHGKIMSSLFHGKPVVLTTEEEFGIFHLIDLKVVKLNRFCNAFQNRVFHKDSIRDDGVYSFMMEELGEHIRVKAQFAAEAAAERDGATDE